MATPAEWGKWAYLALLIPLMVIRVHHRVRHRDARTSLDRKDALETILLAQAAILITLVPLAYALTPLLDFANVALPAWTLLPGVGLLLAGLVLLARTHLQLVLR